MARTKRPVNVEQARANVALLVGERAGKPCPTAYELREITGVACRDVWPFIEELKTSGLIELEIRGEGTDNVWRRMRVAGGQWTDWTQRRKPTRREELMLEAAGGEA